MNGDEFDVDEFAGAGEGEIPREQRWGKPKLPHPETGKVQTWRRPSSITKPLEDRYLLEQWEKRAVAKGMAHREHLRALAYASDFGDPAYRKTLNDVAREAMNWAGTHARAAKGTAQHMLFDAYNRTGAIPGDDQPAMRDDVLAYAAALEAYGLTIDVDMIERMGICPAANAAGSWDAIGRRLAGTPGTHPGAPPAWPKPRILDAKTGKDPDEFHQLAYAGQQAVYSRCTAMVPRVWDPERGREQYEPMPEVDQEWATLIWVELGTAEVEFIDVDLVAGWQAVQLAIEIDRWRKRKDLLVPAFTWKRDVATADPELGADSITAEFTAAANAVVDSFAANPIVSTSAVAFASGGMHVGQVVEQPEQLAPPEPMKPRTPEQQAERERELDDLLATTAAGKAPARKRAAKRVPPTPEQLEETRKTVLAERRAATEAREAAALPSFAETIHDALAAAVTSPVPDASSVLGRPVSVSFEMEVPGPVDQSVVDLAMACSHASPACGPCKGLPVTEWTLREKVANAATREVLSALWRGNTDAWSDELTALGKARLAELGG